MIFQRTALLSFYDDKEDAAFKHRHRGAHVSAITGVIGEELLLGLFLDCMQRHAGLSGEVLKGKPRRKGEMVDGKQTRGNWLDAWVKFQPGHIGQVEIKNWSVHSLGGGKSLALTATNDQVAAAARARWKRYFGKSNDRLPSGAKKVTYDYPAPIGSEPVGRIERILCFWQPVSSNGLEALSRAIICGKEVTVFSGSIYLRQTKDEELELHCPNIEERLRILGALCCQVPRAVGLRAAA